MKAIALFVLFLVSLRCPAQSHFEVASIKLNNGDGQGREVNARSGGRFGVSNFLVKTVIEMAFDVGDSQIVGDPAWISSEGYDFNARAATNANFEQMKPMLQSLLADRFALAVHREIRELPVYSLGVVESGIKLVAPKESSCVVHDPSTPYPPPAGGPRPLFCGNIRMGKGTFDGAGISMSTRIGYLSGVLARPVKDQTGFSETFDVHMQFGDIDSPEPPIFTALQEQLGLRLESTKGPVEVFVIDHVERPSGN